MNKIFCNFLIVTILFALLLLSCQCKDNKPSETGVSQYIYRGEIERSSSWETAMSYDPSIYAQGVNPLLPEPMSKSGVISNADVAVKVAEAVLFPFYGKTKIEEERPYDVFLINAKYWYITGTLHKNRHDKIQFGGTFEIIIKKSDGQIISVFHGK